MQIYTKQINGPDLTNFILAATSGSVFSGNINNYVNASGWLGPNILYITGGTQLVLATPNFLNGISVPYVGTTGQAVNQLYVINSINSGLNILYTGLNFVTITGNDVIGGYKLVTGQIQVQGNPVGQYDAVNYSFLKLVSGALYSGFGNISTTNLVDTFSSQTISGLKTFTILPQSTGTPINPTDLATKSYVDSAAPTGVVYLTGDQTISGNKTFLQSPVVPIATNYNQAVQLAQLNALGTVMGGVTGFAGVLSLNGTSGANGNVFLEPAGTVSIIQCGPIFYISGITPNGLTQLYSAKIILTSGITGIQFTYNSGFSVVPNTVGSFEFEGVGGLSFIQSVFYNVTTGGFNVAFNNPIPNNSYYFNVNVIPTVSGSGFFALQGGNGLLGPSLNPRGIWQQGLFYSQYDVVYNPPYNASYVATSGSASSTFNQPAGSGNNLWTILSSGAQGASGAFIWQGNFNLGSTYNYNYATFSSGSTFIYTGTNSITNVYPNSLTGGWALVAQQGAIGQLIIQSGAYITGNFVNLSYYLNPVGTGYNLAESWVGQTFRFTGYALGCISSGLGSAFGSNGILSGDIYNRDNQNNKYIIQSFTFNSGLYTYFSGGFTYTITGTSRMGIDITNTLSGIQGFSIGIFGF